MKHTYLKPKVEIATIMTGTVMQYASVPLNNDEVDGSVAESNEQIGGKYSIWDDNFDEED